jgi:ribosome-binding factor A
VETRRTKRVADLVRSEVANFLLRKASDPRLRWVTVTDCRVTPDLRHATVYYSCINDPEREDAEKALRKVGGLIRAQMGRDARMRHVPEIEFRFDEGLHHGYRIMEILDQIAQTESPAEESSEPPGSDDADAEEDATELP